MILSTVTLFTYFTIFINLSPQELKQIDLLHYILELSLVWGF